LDNHGHALAAAYTHGLHAEFFVGILEAIKQRGHDASAGAAKGVAQGDGAAVDVEFVVGNAQFVGRFFFGAGFESLRRITNGSVKSGTFEVCIAVGGDAGEVGAGKVSNLKVGAGKVGAGKIGPRQVGALKNDVTEVGANKVGPRQVSAAEGDTSTDPIANEACIAEICQSEVSAGEVRVVDNGLTEIRSDKSSVAEVCGLKVSTGKVGAGKV